MRWPWRRRPNKDLEALEQAKRDLAKTREQWPAVREAAASMRRHKERNHFADSIEAIYAGRRR